MFRLVCCLFVCLFLLFAVYVCFNVQCVCLSTHAINKKAIYLLTYLLYKYVAVQCVQVFSGRYFGYFSSVYFHPCDCVISLIVEEWFSPPSDVVSGSLVVISMISDLCEALCVYV